MLRIQMGAFQCFKQEKGLLMDRQGFPVETLSKKACNISATGMNLELFGKILELEWIWNWTKFDSRWGEWNWTSSNFELEDRNGSRSKKYGPVTMYVIFSIGMQCCKIQYLSLAFICLLEQMRWCLKWVETFGCVRSSLWVIFLQNLCRAKDSGSQMDSFLNVGALLPYLGTGM